MNPSPSADVSQPEAAPRPFAVPLAVSLAVTAALAGASWWAWRQLPVDARIPSHWDAAGRIDSYGGRNSLFFVPGLMLGLTLLFLFVPRIEPRRTHLLLSSRAYRAVWLAMVLALAGLQVFQIRAAFGEELSMEKWHGIGLGALFIVIGNFLGKVRSNFLFGVRTPWTLSSELSWNKTHRLGVRRAWADLVHLRVAPVARGESPFRDHRRSGGPARDGPAVFVFRLALRSRQGGGIQ
jgi:uncharacterized membrane protein